MGPPRDRPASWRLGRPRNEYRGTPIIRNRRPRREVLDHASVNAHTHSCSLSLSLSLSRFISLFHTHTHSLSFSHTLSLSHTHSLSLSHTHTHTPRREVLDHASVNAAWKRLAEMRDWKRRRRAHVVPSFCNAHRLCVSLTSRLESHLKPLGLRVSGTAAQLAYRARYY